MRRLCHKLSFLLVIYSLLVTSLTSYAAPPEITIGAYPTPMDYVLFEVIKTMPANKQLDNTNVLRIKKACEIKTLLALNDRRSLLLILEAQKKRTFWIEDPGITYFL